MALDATSAIVMTFLMTVIILIAVLDSSNAGIVHRIVDGRLTTGEKDTPNNEDLGPPDHLDGLKLERDGDLNVEFHHEIFLGEEKHHFQEKKSKQEQLKKLEEIFRKADTNKDDFVDESELHSWIMKMVDSHKRQAIEESEEKFKFAAGDNAVAINYTQFQKAFLKALGKDNGSHNGKFTQEDIKARLAVIEKQWKDADLNNDDILSDEEFLFFQHPEMSRTTLDATIKEFLNERDYNGDQKLDEKEFVFGFPVGDIIVDDYMDGDELIRDKVMQFRKFIDADGDGFVSVAELGVYLDPFSALNARNDAHDMMFYVDIDQDQRLSLSEVKEASEYLTGTKLYDASLFFHNEL